MKTFEFSKLDRQQIEKDINLKAKAEEDGQFKRPSASSKERSICEAEGVDRIRDHVDINIQRANRYLAPITNRIGFKGYVILFFILIVSRLSAIVLCFVDYGSLYTPGWFARILAIIIFIPGAYTMYSIKKYFGFLRAAGADHFDPKYRDMPFEKRGIFKWTPNAMYVFAIGIPLAFATATGSQSMFIVAIYTYISIWLHYFCTEKEDFKVIYGNN